MVGGKGTVFANVTIYAIQCAGINHSFICKLYYLFFKSFLSKVLPYFPRDGFDLTAKVMWEIQIIKKLMHKDDQKQLSSCRRIVFFFSFENGAPFDVKKSGKVG